MGIYEKEFIIRYSEVDRNNEITPISVMEYFQEIGCLHSDEVKMGLNQNAAWVIIQWKAKILSKVQWNDHIVIRTWPSGIQGPYCMRDYEMYKGDQLVAIGTSKWVLTDLNTHKLIKPNEEVAERFQPIDKKVFSTQFAKLKPCETFEKEMVHEITLRDIDTNQHVNNIKYIELAYNMLEEETDYIEVMYKHSSVFGEKLNCLYNNHEVTIKNDDKISAIVKFKED